VDSLVGRIISHYRILERIGAGGMGVVYKAEDTKLGRTVALKFLPPEMTRDPKAKQRFIQEARAASAMDHSNICTIFEVDEIENDQLFISMAYYQGKTLKERIAAGPIELGEAIDIAAQIAKGLAKAHSHGIVHRDVKPGNVFITGDGQVKVFDFGLAKLAGQLKLTSTGKTMGTVSYMSPEQGRGEEIGPRTDVWALGVILYEMLTGEPPFKGEYDAAVMYSIMNENPAPIDGIRAGVPEELSRIVAKALARSQAERYQNVSEMLSDLNALKQQLDFAHFTGTHEWKFKGKERRWYFVLAAVVIAAAAIAVAWLLSTKRQAESPGLPGKGRQVTSGDVWQGEPALSPDGSSIAYTSDVSGNRDIYVVGVQGGPQNRLTDDPAADYDAAWFPDGTALAFVSDRGGKTGIWKIGRQGGGATPLLGEAIDPAISPVDNRIAFARVDSSGESRIGVASIDDPERITMLTGDDDGVWSHRNPAWSPDGKTICYSTYHDLWTVPADGGQARALTRNGVLDSDPVWSSDGKSVYFSSNREGTLALWRISSKGGKAERRTSGSGYEHDPSTCSNGTRLAYATQTEPSAMFIRDMKSGRDTRLPQLRGNCLAGIAWDGSKIVYATDQGRGNLDLWIQALDRGTPADQLRRLTEDTARASCPLFSPDGQWVAYYRIVGEQRDIYTIPASGGQPIQFTDDPARDTQPAWSPDGSMLAFVSERGSGSHIWVASVKEGRPASAPRRITDDRTIAVAPAWSPDGTRIAFVGFRENRWEVWVVRVDGSAPAGKITSGADAKIVKWGGPMGTLLVSGTWNKDRYSLRRVFLDGSPAAPLEPPLTLGSLTALATFDVTRDGRLLVFSRESIKGNIWVHEAKNGTY
jgi:eukaryotic-like serine/threonine-protein kinase